MRLRSASRTWRAAVMAVALVCAGAGPARAQPTSAVGALSKRSAGSDVWRYACSATLLSPSFALTAAHCFPPSPSEGLDFEFSAVPDLTLAPHDGVRIDRIFVHDDFERGLGSEALNLADIALVRLEAPVAGPIAEVSLDSDAELGSVLAVTAYGADGPTGEPGVRSITSARVSALLGSELLVEAESGSQLCRGDSGGGAFDPIDGRLVAIVSRGVHTGTFCDSEVILTRLAAHGDWLRRQLDEFERGQLAPSAGCSLQADGPHGAGRAHEFAVLLAAGLAARRRKIPAPDV